MRAKEALMLIVVVLTGCATTSPLTPTARLEPGAHRLVVPYIPELNEGGLFHLSCTDLLPSGRSIYADFDLDDPGTGRVALAKRHFIHAAMANNAYLDPHNKPQFWLPGWTLHESLQSESGLTLQVYGDGGSLATSGEIVVAYRGTDSGSRRDWENNFALREPPQYREAYDHLSDLRSLYPDARFTAVGHSLGGGLAMNMSMRVQGVDAVGFNMSPRVRFGATTPYPAYRASLFEVGEILTGLTKFYAAVLLPDDTLYGNYNFLDYRWFRFSPVPEHSIYEFTRALTVLAMTRGSAEAKEFFRRNIGEAQARQVDWAHCRQVFE